MLVVGAGALGNEVLKNLALLGVGFVYVIDLDEVEPSNLSRSVLFRAEDGGRPKAEVAARRAREINPDIATAAMRGDVITDLGLGLFADVDVVIGCLDNREARLWVNRQCWKVGTPWVDAGIQEIQGVVKVFVPPDSACYECAMTERDYQLLNLRYSCPLLRRDQILEGKVPTAPTIASMMGALQVQEALKLIHGLPVAAGSALVFNGVANQFYSTRLPFREDCLSHETYPEPIELPLGPCADRRRAVRRRPADPRGAADPGPRPRPRDRDRLPPLRLASRRLPAEDAGWARPRPPAPIAGSRAAPRSSNADRRRFPAGRSPARPGRHPAV